ncbi:MAG: hypothetical protein V4463_03900 [Pseudomonadota bacterium]
MRPLPLLLVLACAAAHARPYVPARGSDVVERLPQRVRLVATADLKQATEAARRYIVLARSETDPRYYGYAQAALSPWWRLPAPPAEVRLLRATILQSTHHFTEALADLDAVLALDTKNAQAWLTRATVLTVRGDYDKATASCARLSSLVTELVTITCIANVAANTERARTAEPLLDLALRRSDADAEQSVWALTLLAEMAARRGDAIAAEARFQRGLALAPRDSYLLGAYADFLLDQHRPREVIALVAPFDRIDGLLLRHALALKQLNDPALPAVQGELAARFAAAAQRGDTVHQREQARYELHLRGDARAALDLAQKNWAVQKEAADLRILREAKGGS